MKIQDEFEDMHRLEKENDELLARLEETERLLSLHETYFSVIKKLLEDR